MCVCVRLCWPAWVWLCSNEHKFAFLQICVYGMCVTSGFVHGRSAAVPSASAGVCRSYNREGTPTQTAFRGTGYTTGGLNTVYTCIHTPHSRTSAHIVACLMSTRRYRCKNSDAYTHSRSVKQLSFSDVIKDGHGAILRTLCILFYFHRKPPALCFNTRYSQ